MSQNQSWEAVLASVLAIAVPDRSEITGQQWLTVTQGGTGGGGHLIYTAKDTGPDTGGASIQVYLNPDLYTAGGTWDRFTSAPAIPLASAAGKDYTGLPLVPASFASASDAVTSVTNWLEEAAQQFSALHQNAASGPAAQFQGNMAEVLAELLANLQTAMTSLHQQMTSPVDYGTSIGSSGDAATQFLADLLSAYTSWAQVPEHSPLGAIVTVLQEIASQDGSGANTIPDPRNTPYGDLTKAESWNSVEERARDLWLGTLTGSADFAGLDPLGSTALGKLTTQFGTTTGAVVPVIGPGSPTVADAPVDTGGNAPGNGQGNGTGTGPGQKADVAGPPGGPVQGSPANGTLSLTGPGGPGTPGVGPGTTGVTVTLGAPPGGPGAPALIGPGSVGLLSSGPGNVPAGGTGAGTGTGPGGGTAEFGGPPPVQDFSLAAGPGGPGNGAAGGPGSSGVADFTAGPGGLAPGGVAPGGAAAFSGGPGGVAPGGNGPGAGPAPVTDALAPGLLLPGALTGSIGASNGQRPAPGGDLTDELSPPGPDAGLAGFTGTIGLPGQDGKAGGPGTARGQLGRRRKPTLFPRLRQAPAAGFSLGRDGAAVLPQGTVPSVVARPPDVTSSLNLQLTPGPGPSSPPPSAGTLSGAPGGPAGPAGTDGLTTPMLGERAVMAPGVTATGGGAGGLGAEGGSPADDPMMVMPGMVGGAPGQAGQERERHAYLPEDPESWGTAAGLTGGLPGLGADVADDDDAADAAEPGYFPGPSPAAGIGAVTEYQPVPDRRTR